MILTEEIKDEIKLLVVETIKEMELGKNTPSADYPDFESWKDNLIELDCGLKFAPEDFYVGNRKFFTWNEAMEYEEEVLKPNGFRLPTLVEWAMAFCECGQEDDGSDDPDKFEEKLKLKKNGYIPPYRMDDYKKDPSSTSEDDQGSFGYFWSATPISAAVSYGLDYNSGGVNPQGGSNKGYGYSVRCVAVEENDNCESR